MLTFHTLLKGLDIYLTHSQPIQDFGAKTWSAQLSSYHKRQIPGVGRNVYVWQLNAVRPTTGLILHPGNGGHKSLKRKTSRSLLPCLWLPPDALSLDAPWCWSSSFPTEPTFSFMRLMFAGISLLDRVPVSVSDWLSGSFVVILFSICPTQPIFTNTETTMLSTPNPQIESSFS